MKKLTLVLLASIFVAFNPGFSQQAPVISGAYQTGQLRAIGFGFQGSAYKSLNLKLWKPSAIREIEQPDEVETPVATTIASETANASATAPLPQIRKSELQARYDQRLQGMRQSNQGSEDGINTPRKSDLQRRLDQRLRNNGQNAADNGSPRKSEMQLKYDQRLRTGSRIISGGADQPPIEINHDSDGSIIINNVEFTLKFVFYQNDFSSFSADVFSADGPDNSGNDRITSRLTIPVGNLRLEKAADFKVSRAYTGSLNLSDDASGISGKYEVWLNDLGGR
ncbi:MAG: hypothetical protein CVV42_12685 [Candidatus Riflebacteria bacterium HGW-Riflebacteria-2]|jgi:hypothetical protein|nr:MAG: hypothetical protein CVV42_12685 [Candidatus Riflebacteria bacterium HGW-Riflebacteria-2]